MKKDVQNQEIKGRAQGIENPMERPYPFFKRFMTLPEAAFYCGQAESTVKRAVYNGQLPVIQRGDRSKWILDAYDLDHWMLTWKRFHRPVDERQRTREGKFK